MTTSIKIEGLSKRYRLGLTHAGSIRELVNQFSRRLVPRRSGSHQQDVAEPSQTTKSDSFWALKDVEFSIQQGESVGIIGRNGAGKSTLLKILSRITSPTTGRVELVGRVASLLEVGTGFHPELTGRENLYLNGTILGMTRAEVNRQFDAIVDFAGVEKFIDTPVKRYSSGMKVRLGFAVAAHLEPEILIVDEVLAVGDMDFQRKCLGKMDDVAKSGRTIMFVSHNMAAVSQLCHTGVVLNQGMTDGVMPISQAIDVYMKQAPGTSRDGLFIADSSQDAPGAITRIRIRQEGNETGTLRHNEDFEIVYTTRLASSAPDLRLSTAICDRLQQKIFTAVTEIKHSKRQNEIELTLQVRGRFLMPGRYSLIAGLLDPRMQLVDWHRFVCPFQIENVGDDPLLSGGGDLGVVFGEHQWLTN
ncbi:MAG: ABC transporter ATP-binding protein [Planctomycetales bacterium]|nr:ABC transporter ATP-binding protein [Planctomycetales bacterium]